MSTISQNLTRLQTAKANIANSIITMGGTVGSGDGFEDFVTDILTIPQGASGITVSEEPTQTDKIFDYNIKTILYVSDYIGIYVCAGTYKLYNVYYSSSSTNRWDLFTIGDIQIPWTISTYDTKISDPRGAGTNFDFISYNRTSQNNLSVQLQVYSTTKSPVIDYGTTIRFYYLEVKRF